MRRALMVVDRIPLHRIAHGFHVAFSADGRLGVVAELHPKNLVPLAHLEHGGAFVDTLTLFGADVGTSRSRCLWTSWNATRRGRSAWRLRRTSRACMSPAAARRCVTVIDVPRLLRLYSHAPWHHMQQDLSASANYVVARIAVGHDPRGVALTRDGRSCLWPTGSKIRSA